MYEDGTQRQVTTDENGAAVFLDVKVSCMRAWRQPRQGPAYVRVGRLIRYRLQDLEKFLQENRVDPNS
jgi:hypothetical protein